MRQLELLGAMKFLDKPKGTFYIPFIEKSEQKCWESADKFLDNPYELMELQQLHIYGDNGGSMCLSSDCDNKYIFYYDANVVGDAIPETTLYLVFDDTLIPDSFQYIDKDYFDDGLNLTREQVLKVRDDFLLLIGDNDYDPNIEARDYLDKNYKDNKIVNFCLKKSLGIDEFREMGLFKYQGFSKEQAREMYRVAKSYAEFTPVSIEEACKTILLMYQESKMSET